MNTIYLQSIEPKTKPFDYALYRRNLRQVYLQKRRGQKTYTGRQLIGTLVITLTLISLSSLLLSDYRSRIREYNAHRCATWGYQEDCRTPLAQLSSK